MMMEERIYVVNKIREELLVKIHQLEMIRDKSVEIEESIKVLNGAILREIEPRLKVYKKR